MIEANILLIKCPKAQKTIGVRIQKMEDGDWWRTWAFPLKMESAQDEGYDATPVKGNLFCTEDYPGCPHCGTGGFVQCNQCRKLTCYNNESSLICGWCGNLMDNIVTATDKFDVSGSGY